MPAASVPSECHYPNSTTPRILIRRRINGRWKLVRPAMEVIICLTVTIRLHFLLHIVTTILILSRQDTLKKIQEEHNSQPDAPPLSIEDISVQVFDKRSGYVKGTGMRSSSSYASTASSIKYDEQVKRLEERLHQMEEYTQQLQDQTKQKAEEMAQQMAVQMAQKMKEQMTKRMEERFSRMLASLDHQNPGRTSGGDGGS